jgi:hypothetical protein
MKAAFKEGSPLGLQTALANAQGDRATSRLIVRIHHPLESSVNFLDNDSSTNDYIEHIGMSPPALGWRRVPSTKVRSMLQVLTLRDLAYRAEVGVPTEAADELIDAWLSYFHDEASFFTCGDSLFEHAAEVLPQDFVSLGHDQITTSTFDAGVMGVGASCIGIFWAIDED